ncbi:hypothetical protein [Pseudoalteromonas undina]|uniref:hypothetical protein n=1 Tax=Pseudoalteromonas undina TaxID=43660 RepID=UPI001865ACBB|nr:hypothetical protein [Pseudoalteromonas undina]
MNGIERSASWYYALSSGHIEVAGSEDFVSGIFPEIIELLNREQVQLGGRSDSADIEVVDVINAEPSMAIPVAKEKKKKAPRKAPAVKNIPPIPINLKGHEGGVSLMDFIAEKQPKLDNAQELITVFIYYLVKLGGLNEVLPGHIISCYNEIKERKPSNTPQIMANIKNRKAYIDSAEEKGSYTISITGENLVEHDLPASS